MQKRKKVVYKSLPKSMNFIPLNIFRMIFSYLELEELICLRQVCTLFRNIVSDDHFWKEIYFDYFKIDSPKEKKKYDLFLFIINKYKKK